MESLKLKEEIYIIKKLNEDLEFYNQLLKELMLYLDIRNEVKNKFKSMDDDFYKYIEIGEILDDITRNYTGYDSVSNSSGEIIDFKKVYCLKAEQEILNSQMLLIELEEDEVDENYIKEIKNKLDRYTNKNIFDELLIIQELLLKISNPLKEFHDEIDIFLNKLVKFNDLIELDKNKYLNSFCYENIENNSFVDKLINLQSDYNSAEVIANVVEVEGMPLFSIWNSEKLKPILEYNSKIYFKIISTLNELQQLNQDLLNIVNVNSQIEIIEEFLDIFS